MRYFIAFLIVLYLYGCKTTETKAKRYFVDHPRQFAGLCGDYYKPQETTKPGKTIFLPGDTIIQKGDSIPCPDKPAGQKEPIKVRCPDNKIIHDTVFRVDTVFRDNPGKTVACEEDLKISNNEIIKLKERAKNQERQAWYSFFAGLLALPMGFGAFKLIKLFI